MLEDPSAGLHYWFVPVRTAADWAFPRHADIHVHGETAYIPIPGTQRTTGPRWRIPPRPDTYITDPDKLLATLYDAVETALGPHEGCKAPGDAAYWLASTANAPGPVLREWARGELALIPTGVRFDVVRVIHRLGCQLLRDLHAHPGLGPVMHTGSTAVEFLVPKGTTTTWSMPLTTTIGKGKRFACPDPRLLRRTVRRRHWSHWPQAAEGPALTDPHLLANAIHAAGIRQRGEFTR
ncbi:hypothetical protein [Streptantibioticus ferralitis]|uniref:Uncharacterized protein n=1 Tax=Streptantibioticus ferralitis TaxID=236510 RepID=A0ABT5ZC21_9ACTN|nr:hypothetical protein [Streptantibioticus ferralitis]MDF2261379.1 hypothetical protein [Streptantibioticus ferralitis]